MDMSQLLSVTGTNALETIPIVRGVVVAGK